MVSTRGAHKQSKKKPLALFSARSVSLSIRICVMFAKIKQKEKWQTALVARFGINKTTHTRIACVSIRV